MTRRRPPMTLRLTADLTPDLHDMLETLKEIYHVNGKVDVVRIAIRHLMVLQRLPQDLRGAIMAEVWDTPTQK